MVARKKVCPLVIASDIGLRKKIEASTKNKRSQEAMEKDCHLVEAAIAADQIVLSLDETARGLFDQAAVRVGELRVVVWANPSKPEDGCLPWLEAGAPVEKSRQLG